MNIVVYIPGNKKQHKQKLSILTEKLKHLTKNGAEKERIMELIERKLDSVKDEK